MCEIDRSSKSQIFLGDIETNFHDTLKQIPKKLWNLSLGNIKEKNLHKS